MPGRSRGAAASGRKARKNSEMGFPRTVSRGLIRPSGPAAANCASAATRPPRLAHWRPDGPTGRTRARAFHPCLTVVVAALLATPAVAAPDFGGATMDPVVFYTTPGSSCAAQPPNSATLPIATGTGTISYAVADLPAGFSFDANTRTLTGDPATITESLGVLAYTATDSADGRRARLVFRWSVVDERTALQILYRLTGGDTWTNKSGGWANPITATCLGHLHGVDLNSATGRVRHLQLSGNNLNGWIPPELGTLTALVHLDLSANQLRGRIPPALGKLTALTHLNLRTNQLIGSIPPELGKLAALNYLLLHINRLSGQIPDLSGLTNLIRLDLHTNRLSGQIPDLSALTSLEHLLLHTNRLSGPIPTTLGTLSRLVSLLLHTNQLTGPLPDLSGLSSLTTLLLQNNQLTSPLPTMPDPGDPDTRISALPPILQNLNLNTNRLTGPLPAILPASLLELNLAENQLHGPIPDLRTRLPKLWQLDLYDNQLGRDANGQKILTPDLDTLIPPTMERLSLDGNQLSGPIPDLSALTSLLYLFLYNNQLSGPIPDLSALTSLEHLYLHTNRLGTHADGTVTDISGLPAKLPTSLTQLDLHNNQLSGEIPALSSLTGLTRLYLHNNGLSGEIPDLSSLTGLSRLDLSDNQLTGPIPDLSLGANAALYLHNNQLSGAIPALASAGSTILRLSLYGNPDLYGYPAALNTRPTLRLLAPGDGTAVCLPSTQGGTDCTVPTLVDNLRVQVSSTRLKFSWEPNPADPTPSGYTPTYWAAGVGWSPAPPATAMTPAIRGTTAIIHGLTPGASYSLLVRTADSSTTPQLYYVVTTPPDDDDTQDPPPPPPEDPPPQDPPPSDPPGGGGNVGGGGGGGGSDPAPNRPPAAADPVGNRELNVGGAVEIDVSDSFRDPEGRALRFEAESSDRRVARVEVAGSVVTLRGRGHGVATVTVTAVDDRGARASQEFEAAVGHLLSFAETALSVPEGGAARLTIAFNRPRGEPTTARYTVGADADPATMDADAADHDGVGGELTLTAGESEAHILIAVHDDDDIEPPEEVFVVALVPPEEREAGFGVGDGTAMVTVAEGVCDRTPQVREALRGFGPCADATAARLARRQALRLEDSGIAALRPLDLSGLSGLRVLDLSGNDLQALPAGMFAGLSGLGEVDLRGNPGAPFELVFDLVRTDALPWAPGPATVVARVAQGAPFEMRGELSVDNGVASVVAATIGAGALESAPFEVSASGPGAVRVSLPEPPPIPDARCGDVEEGPPYPCYQGLATAAGPPLVLFKDPPAVTAAPPEIELSTEGDEARADISGLFAASDGGPLTFSAVSRDPALATARVSGGVLIVASGEGGAEGVATIAVTATDADGLSVTLELRIRIEYVPRGFLRGWRRALPQISERPGEEGPG